MIKHSEEFKREAVRIALTSGLPRERVASDLGIGKSTFNKWVSHYRPSDLVAAPQADLSLGGRKRTGALIQHQECRHWSSSLGVKIGPVHR